MHIIHAIHPIICMPIGTLLPEGTGHCEETDTQFNNEKSVIRVSWPICDDCSVRTAVIKLNVGT